MRTSLHVYRVFHPDHVPPPAAAGLDFSGFAAYRAAAREATPFAGAAARRINSGEAFYRDAADCVREGRFTAPNPCGPGTLETTDVAVLPSIPWTTVPLYVYRFSAPECFYVVKRGLSWCTDLGLVFPDRQLFVSFQPEERRMAQDIADVEHVLARIAVHHSPPGEPPSRGRERAEAAYVLLTSDHFAHHLWNELSVIEGLVADGLHPRVRLLVNRQPVAPIAALFPELSAAQIEVIDGSPDVAMASARHRGLFVVPAGRRYVPTGLVDRVLRVARASHPEAAADAAAWPGRHDLVVWVTVRLDVRTATNLIDALGHALSALRARVASMGLIVDGFTRPDGAGDDWNRALIEDEQRVATELVTRVGAADHVVLVGRPTTEAFVWATTADYYICPYGSAQHKVAWIHPVPGLVHAGENKRQVADLDPSFHVRQQGAGPAFFFAPVTRRDVAADARPDLFSYHLDPAALTTALIADLDARVPRHRAAGAER